MAFTVAISGKGGTGKTTVAALIVRLLVERFGKTVLAVDADPNATLGMALGLEVDETVSDLREDVVERRVKVDAGASRERQIEMMIHETVIEGQGFDLLTMGRPEGPKCYCYVNHMLRNFLNAISKSVPFVVMDNEAGMEHLSRLTTDDVDLLLEVAAPTVSDLASAGRIDRLVDRLPIRVRRRGLLVNRSDGPLPQNLEKLIAEAGLKRLGSIPFSQAVEELSREGKPLTGLPLDDPAASSVTEIVQRHVLKSL